MLGIKTQFMYFLILFYIWFRVNANIYFLHYEKTATPREWNDLPVSPGTKEPLNTFKKDLTSHLFDEHYKRDKSIKNYYMLDISHTGFELSPEHLDREL